MYLVLLLNEPYNTINHDHVLGFLKRKSADKHRSKFFVIIEMPFLPKKWIKDIFQLFWDKLILNVVIIFWSDELRVYTFNPFFDDFYVRLSSNITRADDLFYDKLVNQNGKQLYVSLFPEEVIYYYLHWVQFFETKHVHSIFRCERFRIDNLSWLARTDSWLE